MKVIRVFYKKAYEDEEPRTKSIIAIRLKSNDHQFIRLWTHKGVMELNKDVVTTIVRCPKKFLGELPPEEEVMQ